MYCRKCGKEINDTAAFCRYCGEKVENQGSPADKEIKEEKYWKNGPGREKSNKKKMPQIMLGVVAVIVVIVLVVSVFGKKSGAKNSAENVAVASEKYKLEQNIDKYYELLAPPYENYMAGSGGWYQNAEEFKQSLLEWDEDYRNEMINRCGEDFKVNYSVEKTISYDEEELNAVQSYLARDYDYEGDEIEAAAVVDVRIEGSGSKGEVDWTHEISCVKIGGKWYIHRPGFD